MHQKQTQSENTGDPREEAARVQGLSSNDAPPPQNPDRTHQNKTAMKSNLTSVALVLFGTALVLLATWEQPWTPLRRLGLCLLVPSSILWMTARFQLGGSFSVHAEARKLVTRGLYSRIQNPIYLFGSTTTIALILLLNKPWYLMVFLIIIPVQIIRIRRERKALSSTFGNAYLDYQKQTWF